MAHQQPSLLHDLRFDDVLIQHVLRTGLAYIGEIDQLSKLRFALLLLQVPLLL